jgi:cytoplasmic FMR1 interacting protein
LVNTNFRYVIFPFDIYNDAANKSLHEFKSRFLFDEIEAEVNLCFDQFLWKFSRRVFVDFKTRASAMLLDKAFKRDAEIKACINSLEIPQLRYLTILNQPRFEVNKTFSN